MYLLKEIYKHLGIEEPIKRTCEEMKVLRELCDKEGFKTEYELRDGDSIIDGERLVLYSSKGDTLSDVIYSPCCYGYRDNLMELMWHVGEHSGDVRGYLTANEVLEEWKKLLEVYK